MSAPSRRDALCALLVFALGFSLFWMFRGLGWFAQDEGVLYYHYLRTYHGQVPYRDFFTGYGPVSLYLHAGLFWLFGVSLDSTRIFMAGVNALSGVFLFLVTRRFAPWPYAVVPALLFCTLQPGDIADMAFHNTPYPLWYLVTYFSMATWAMLRFVETENRRAAAAWLFLVGAIGGLALFTKQNGGIFVLWGATGFIASYPLTSEGRSEGAGWRGMRTVYLGLIPLSMLILIWTFLSVHTLLSYIVPTAALAVIGARRGFSRSAITEALWSIVWLTLGAVAATGPWFVLFADTVGVYGFIEALFFWGKYVDRMIFLAFPMPGQLAAFVVGGVLVAWYAGATLQRHRGNCRPRWVLPAVIAPAVVYVAVLIGFLAANWADVRRLFYMQYNPWRIYQSASLALDSTFSYLIFPVLAGGLMLAWRQARGEVDRVDPEPQKFLCLMWMSVCSLLLYYPRMDAAHFVSAAALLYAVGAVLVRVAADRVVELAGGSSGILWRRAMLAAASLFVAFAVNLKLAPKVYSVVMLRKDGSGFPLVATPHAVYAFERLHVYFPIYEKTHRLAHEAFLDAIDYVVKNTAPDEPVFTFPAYPMLYFTTSRENPTRHDYFLSNNVPFDEQIKLLDTLEESEVRLLVVPSDENDYFVDVGRPYHDLIWAYIRQEFYLERRFGAYDIWRRYDGIADKASGDPPARQL